MLNKKEFAQELINNIEKLSEYKNLELIEVPKDNGEKHIGIRFMLDGNENEGLGAIYYVEDFYSEYINGDTIEHISKNFISEFKSFLESNNMTFSIDVFNKFVGDYMVAKDNIVAKLSNKSFSNLINEPFTVEGEFLATYHVELPDSVSTLSASVRVTDDLLKKWGVELEDVRASAISNMKKSDPLFDDMLKIALNPFTNDMCQLSSFDDNNVDNDKLYVLTNDDKEYGASLILVPEFMENIYNKFNDDFYICCVSKHEAIIIPSNSKFTEERILDVNKGTIAETVEKKDYLSEKIYRYDSLNKKIVLNDDYKKNHFYELACELDSIYHNIDPYDYSDTYEEGSVDKIANNLEEGFVEPFVSTLNNFKDETNSAEMKEIFGVDPDRLNKIINCLNNISNNREEVINHGKSHSR